MRRWQAHPKEIWSLAFAPDGRAVGTGGTDHRVALWDPLTGEELRSFAADPAGYSASVSFHPAGRLVAVACHHTVAVHDRRDGALVREHVLTRHHAQTVAFSPDGGLLAVGGGGRVSLLDDDGTTARKWNLRAGNALYVAWSADGRLAVPRDYGPVIIYDPSQAKPLGRYKHPGRSDTHGVAWSPDGASVAACYDDGTVRVWDVATARARHTLDAHASTAFAAAYRPDGRILATAGQDGVVRLWDADTGRDVARFDWQVGPVNRLAFAPDGLTLAATSRSGYVVVWDAEG